MRPFYWPSAPFQNDAEKGLFWACCCKADCNEQPAHSTNAGCLQDTARGSRVGPFFKAWCQVGGSLAGKNLATHLQMRGRTLLWNASGAMGVLVIEGPERARESSVHIASVNACTRLSCRCLYNQVRLNHHNYKAPSFDGPASVSTCTSAPMLATSKFVSLYNPTHQEQVLGLMDFRVRLTSTLKSLAAETLRSRKGPVGRADRSLDDVTCADHACLEVLEVLTDKGTGEGGGNKPNVSECHNCAAALFHWSLWLPA